MNYQEALKKAQKSRKQAEQQAARDFANGGYKVYQDTLKFQNQRLSDSMKSGKTVNDYDLNEFQNSINRFKKMTSLSGFDADSKSQLLNIANQFQNNHSVFNELNQLIVDRNSARDKAENAKSEKTGSFLTDLTKGIRYAGGTSDMKASIAKEKPYNAEYYDKKIYDAQNRLTELNSNLAPYLDLSATEKRKDSAKIFTEEKKNAQADYQLAYKAHHQKLADHYLKDKKVKDIAQKAAVSSADKDEGVVPAAMEGLANAVAGSNNTAASSKAMKNASQEQDYKIQLLNRLKELGYKGSDEELADTAKEIFEREKRGETKKRQDKINTEIAEFSSDHPVVASVASTVAGGAAKIPGAIYSTAKTIEGWTTDKPVYMDENSAFFRGSNITGTITNTVAGNIKSDAWREVYTGAMSFADNLSRAAISFALGPAGETASLAVMAASVMSDTALEMTKLGYDARTAGTLATVAATAEIITEKISLDSLLEKVPNGTGARGYFLKIAKQIFAEASEEGASDVINNVADLMLEMWTDQDSQKTKQIDSYIQSGMSFDAAYKKWQKEHITEYVKDMAMGGLSGGLMGGGFTAVNVGYKTAKQAAPYIAESRNEIKQIKEEYKRQGKNITSSYARTVANLRGNHSLSNKTNYAGYKSLINNGLNHSDTKVREQAAKLSENFNQSGKVSAVKAGKLMNAINDANTRISQGVSAQMLKSSGASSAVIETVKRAVAGDELSKADIKRIRDSADARAIISSLYQEATKRFNNPAGDTVNISDKTTDEDIKEIAGALYGATFNIDTSTDYGRAYCMAAELRSDNRIGFRGTMGFVNGYTSDLGMDLEGYSLMYQQAYSLAKSNEYANMSPAEKSQAISDAMTDNFLEGVSGSEMYARVAAISQAVADAQDDVALERAEQRAAKEKQNSKRSRKKSAETEDDSQETEDDSQENDPFAVDFEGKAIEGSREIVESAKKLSRLSEEKKQEKYKNGGAIVESEKKLDARQSAIISFYDYRGKKYGITYRFVDSLESGARGTYKNDVITIQINNIEDMTSAAAHELGHYLQEHFEDEYKALQDYIKNTLFKQKGISFEEEIEKMIANYKENGQTIDRDMAFEEITNDCLFGVDMASADFEEFVKANQSIVEKAFAFLKKLMRDVQHFLEDWRKRLPGLYKGVTDIDMIQALYDDVEYISYMADQVDRILGKTVEAARAEEFAGVGTETEEGQKNSTTAQSDERYSFGNSKEVQQRDKAYMQAVESGDEQEQQRLVEQAAKAWGAYSVDSGKPKDLYHGTFSDDFTEFDENLIGAANDLGFFGKGFYFAFTKGEAKTYGDNVLHAYLKLENPFNFKKELYTYNQERAKYSSEMVFVVNMAKKFPSLLQSQSVRAAERGSSEIKELSFEKFAKTFEKVFAEKKFDVVEVKGIDGKEWLVRTDEHIDTYTGRDGKKHSVKYYDFEQRFINEDDARNHLNQVGSYLSHSVFSYLDIPRQRDVIQSIEFSEELKSRGFDGVIQSENGDEAVAFYPEQIKLADPVTYDDNGDVIPLSERFSESKDIRYSFGKKKITQNMSDYSEFDKSITKEDIKKLHSISEKSIADFSSEDIILTQKWAHKFYVELEKSNKGNGIKSPFFRRWFGDWRAQEKTEVKVVEVPTIDIEEVALQNGDYLVEDTKWLVHAGSLLNSETRHHSGGKRINVKSLTALKEILQNAVLLDSIVSNPNRGKKSPKTEFLHKLYSIVKYEGKYYIAKVSVEEFYNDSINADARRGYDLKAIKIEPAGGYEGIIPTIPDVGEDSMLISISDLYKLVKHYDIDFHPGKAVAPQLLDENGVPKVFYHGSPNNEFTVFDKSKIGSNTDSGVFGKGFYFSSKENQSSQFGKFRQFYLNAKNPLVLSDADLNDIADKLNMWEGNFTVADGVVKPLYSQVDQFTSHLRDAEYDSVYVQHSNGADELVVFEPSQIKSATDNIGTFDSNEGDIRYQFANTLSSERRAEIERRAQQREMAKLERENENLKEALAAAKKQTKLSKDFRHDAAQVPKVADRLIKQLSVVDLTEEQREQFISDLDYLYSTIDDAKLDSTGGSDITFMAAVEAAQTIAKNIKFTEHSEELVDRAEELVDYFKGRTYISQQQAKELRYHFDGSVAKANQVVKGLNFSIAKGNETTLDMRWNELCEMFPEYFEATSDVEEPLLVIKAMQEAQEAIAGTLYSPFDTERLAERAEAEGYDIPTAESEELSDLAMKLIDSYSEAEWQATFADKKRVQKTVALIKVRQEARNAMQRYRKQVNDRNIAFREKLTNEYREKYNKAVSRSEAKVELEKSKLAAYKEKVAESRKKATERKKQTEIKNKIRKMALELARLGGDPNKKKHLPNGLVKVTKEFLELIDTGDRNNGKLSQYVYNINTEFARIEGHPGYDALSDNYNNIIKGQIEEIAVEIGHKNLNQLTSSELQKVWECAKTIKHSVVHMNRFFLAEKNATPEQFQQNLLTERKGKDSQKELVAAMGIKRFIDNDLKPFYFFNKLQSPTMLKLYQGLRAGQDVWATDIREGEEAITTIKERNNYSSWDQRKKYEFKLESGQTVSLNLQQIMSLRAYADREASYGHIYIGGIKLMSGTEATRYLKDKVTQRLDNTRYEISPADLEKITRTLTKEQTDYVIAMRNYLTSLGEKGNQVSRALFDLELFKELNYFPMRSSQEYTRQGEYKEVGEKKLKNWGNSKPLVPGADNPLVIEEFNDVWARHVNEMALYHAFTLPLEDFQKVYGYYKVVKPSEEKELRKNFADDKAFEEHMPTTASIRNLFSVSEQQYISQFLRNLNGGVKKADSTFSGRGIAKYKKMSTALNLRVAVQQPGAMARAFLYINPKYFAKTAGKGFTGFKSDSKTVQEMEKYSGAAFIKSMGYFDVDTGKTAEEFLLDAGEQYKGAQKAKGFFLDGKYRDSLLLMGPEVMDRITWVQIWEATKAKVSAEEGLSGEALLKRTGELFSAVVDKTQVYDSVFTRSGHMRSTDALAKMATSFMAEPTTTINMLYDAVTQFKAGKVNKKFVAGAFASCFTATLFTNLLASVVSAMRHGKKDDNWWELWTGEFTADALNDLILLNSLPIVRDVYNLAKGYDIERADMTLVSDWISSIKKLSEASKNGTLSYKEWINFMSSSAVMLGLPLKSLYKDINGIFTAYQIVTNGTSPTREGMKKAVKKGALDTLVSDNFLPVEQPSTNKYDTIYLLYAGGNAKEAEKRKEILFKYDEKANQDGLDGYIKKQLQSNKDVIRAAEALQSGDLSKTKAELAKIKGFDESIVVKAMVGIVNDQVSDEEKVGTDTLVKLSPTKTIEQNLLLNNPTIRQAAIALNNNDDEERYNLQSKLVSEGYSVNDVINATRNLKSKMFPGEKKEDTSGKEMKYFQYSDVADALKANKVNFARDVMKKLESDYSKDGKSAADVHKQVRSKITSTFKEEYYMANESRRAEIRKLMWASGAYDSVDDVTKACKKWVKDIAKKKYGN